jgi:hypothetical protein
MAIATFDELRHVARYDAEDRFRVAKSIGGKNLFLSHSLSDLQHVKFAVDLLEQNGAKVYVDVRDASVANVSAAEAAKRLRSAIRETKRLVVVATENTHTSRWIPWEMGLADAATGQDRIALLPLRATSSASELWARQEYFELYARIERVASGSSPSWLVYLPDGNVRTLSHWLDTSKPT